MMDLMALLGWETMCSKSVQGINEEKEKVGRIFSLHSCITDSNEDNAVEKKNILIRCQSQDKSHYWKCSDLKQTVSALQSVHSCIDDDFKINYIYLYH